MEENDELKKKLLSHDLLKIEKIYFFDKDQKNKMIKNLYSIKERLQPERFKELETLLSIAESPIIVDSIEELVSNTERSKIEKILSKEREESDLRNYLDKNLLRSLRISYIFILTSFTKEGFNIEMSDEINEKIRLFLFDFDGREDSFAGLRYKSALNNRERTKIAFRARELSVLIFNYFIDEIKKNLEMQNA